MDEGFVIEQKPEEGTRVEKGSTVTITVSSGPREVEVPRLAGLTYEEALDALNEVNLDPRRVDVFSQKPVGQVTAQDPAAGELVDEGTEVEVRVSKGVREVQVPDVVGQSEASARSELEAAGFEVAVNEAPSDTAEGPRRVPEPIRRERGGRGINGHDHGLVRPRPRHRSGRRRRAAIQRPAR